MTFQARCVSNVGVWYNDNIKEVKNKKYFCRRQGYEYVNFYSLNFIEVVLSRSVKLTGNVILLMSMCDNNIGGGYSFL